MLIGVYIIEAFLVSGRGRFIINACLEDTIVKFGIFLRLIQVTAEATLNWEIIRMHEKVAAT